MPSSSDSISSSVEPPNSPSGSHSVVNGPPPPETAISISPEF